MRVCDEWQGKDRRNLAFYGEGSGNIPPSPTADMAPEGLAKR